MAGRLIHVVRHAHAGDRQSWGLDDDLRPLSGRGVLQAEALVAGIGGERPAALWSSPSLRCIATVLPLARAHDVELRTHTALYEGQGAAAMLALVLGAPTHPVVACTHGDVIGDLLHLLDSRGIALGSGRAEKAGTWTLQVVGVTVVSASYLAPPAT
ncbi:MAG: SixA phosphatase family protein [Candidatus Dormibacteria bacterium]